MTASHHDDGTRDTHARLSAPVAAQAASAQAASAGSATEPIGWHEDVLGAPFEARTLHLGHDNEGEIVATIVRALPQKRRFWMPPLPLDDVDVLYVHGWSDYFFQRELARFWTDRGARFFALDLRKYGRSLRDGQTPGYITDLHDYDADIAAAMEAMGGSDRAPTPGRRLVLLGHSTGGLVLSLWADRHPGVASAVVLNSPWLEFQLSGAARTAVAPVLGLGAKLNPLNVLPQADLGFYTRAQREVRDEPIDYNLAWRPEQAFVGHTGWLHAIMEGHRAVASGLHIDSPVMVMLSTRTVLPTHWTEDLTRADSVLVVDDIARRSLSLGESVSLERIPGALHDVFISRADARDIAYDRLDRWVRGFLGVKHVPLAPGSYR